MVGWGRSTKKDKEEMPSVRVGEPGAVPRKDEGGSGGVSEGAEPKAVSVMVRVRPLSTVEHADPSVKNVVHCLEDGVIINGVPPTLPSHYYCARRSPVPSQHFKVDKVFHPHSSQIEVYAACRGVVEGVFEGINGSILAYGATGSGKTHTMFGGSMSVVGVMYQAVEDILERKGRLERSGKIVTVRGSFLEVYNEEVFDLLTTSNLQGKRTPLKVQKVSQGSSHGDADKEVNCESFTVKGLTSVTFSTKEDFTRCVERGHANRFVASTTTNAQSSRSHAILTLELEVRDALGASCGTSGRIRFCDLAGSERAAGTSNNGLRLKEGGNINRSLLALGAVVQALVQRGKYPNKVKYIPYRGSKLTRLLRDCLGGNCRTLMIFCVSPSSMHYEETINSMIFAMQAKEIQVAAKRHEFRMNSNEVAQKQETIIEELRRELAMTREELLRIKGSTANATPGLAELSCLSSQVLADGSSIGPLLSSSKDEAFLPLTESNHADIATGSRMIASSAPTNSKQQVSCVSKNRLTEEDEEEQEEKEEEGRSHMYTDLEKKLKTFSLAKETLYREMREAEEANSELDIRLRQHKWKLIRFLATNKRHEGDETVGVAMTSVGVAGLQRAIDQMEAESAMQGEEMERLLARMNAMDLTVAGIRGELLRKKQHPLLELLLENVKMRQSCTEAECLAAHYHQECRSIMNHEEEYAQALSVCISAIRRMLPLVSNTRTIREEVQLAFMFANLPSLSTGEMIPVFENSMKTENLPSTSLLESNRLLSSVESMEARLQRLASDSAARKPAAARLPVQQRIGMQVKSPVKTTANGKFAAVSAASKSIRNPQTVKMPGAVVSESFTRSHSTPNLRKATEIVASLARKPSCRQRPTANCDGKRKVSFSVTTKGESSPLLLRQQGSPSLNGSGTKGIKGNAPLSFCRSHTLNEIRPHKQASTTSPAPLEPSGGTNRKVRRPQKTLAARRSFSPERKRDATAVRARPDGHVMPLKSGGQVTTGLPQKAPQNSDLEERYDKLLSEVQQLNHGVTTAPATVDIC